MIASKIPIRGNFNQAIQQGNNTSKSIKDLSLMQFARPLRPLSHMPNELRQDKELLLETFKKENGVLKYVDAAVKEDGNAFEYVDAILKKDKEVALAAVKENSRALEYTHHSIKNTIIELR